MSIGAIYGGGSSISAWDHYIGLKESLSVASSSGSEPPLPDSATAPAAQAAVPAPVTVTSDSSSRTSSGAMSSTPDPQSSARALAGQLASHAGASAQPDAASAGKTASSASDPDIGGDTHQDGDKDGTGLTQYTQALQAFAAWSDRTIIQSAASIPTPIVSLNQMIAKTSSPG